MKILQDGIDDITNKLPQHILGQIVTDKIQAEGIHLSSREIKRIQKHILDSRSKPLILKRWRFWDRKPIDISFGPEELRKINRLPERLANDFPRIIEGVVSETAAKIHVDLRARWEKEQRLQNRELQGFRRRLFDRWGTAIG